MTVLYGLTAPFTDAGLHIASYNNGLHSVQILSWSAGVGDGKTAVRRRQSQEVAEADPRRTELSRQPRVVASVPGASARNSHVRRPAHRHSGNTQDRLVQLERVFIVSDVVVVEKTVLRVPPPTFTKLAAHAVQHLCTVVVDSISLQLNFPMLCTLA